MSVSDPIIANTDLASSDDVIAGRTKAAAWIRDVARRYGVTYTQAPVDKNGYANGMAKALHCPGETLACCLSILMPAKVGPVQPRLRRRAERG